MWIPKFFARFLGRRAAESLKLEEGKMEDTKRWFASKGVGTASVTALLGLYLTLAPNFGWPVVPEWIFAFLGAMGLYSRVTAEKKIG